MNTTVTNAARKSETMMDSHIPSDPRMRGSSSTDDICSTDVLRKEMIAEIRPLLRAVKSADPKIPMPEKRKEKE